MNSVTVMRRAVQVLLLLAGVALAGCQAVYENHGYVPTDRELSQVVVGKTSRDQLSDLIGRPSSSGVLAGSGWYYVGSRWKYLGAFKPKEVDRQVVAISFNDRGIVSNVERFGLDKGEVVVVSRRVTASNIKGIGVVRQLLGNFGRISANQIADVTNR